MFDEEELLDEEDIDEDEDMFNIVVMEIANDTEHYKEYS